MSFNRPFEDLKMRRNPSKYTPHPTVHGNLENGNTKHDITFLNKEKNVNTVHTTQGN